MNLNLYDGGIIRLNVLGASDITADGNGTGVAKGDLTGIGRLDVSALNIAGTNPTLGLSLEHSDDDGVADAYAAVSGVSISSITDVANLTQTVKVDWDQVKAYVRIVKDIGGTSSPRFFALVTGYGFDRRL